MLSAGQKQLRLNNVQINVAAGKVIKKKKLLEGDSEGNHQQHGPASIRLSGKTLLTQKQAKVILNTQTLAQGNGGQPSIQRVIKQNLIRVKQAQIDFDKHQKQHLNIKLVPSGKGGGNGGSSKRVGLAQQNLQLHQPQKALADLAQSKPRNYSSEASKPAGGGQSAQEVEPNFKNNMSRLSDATAKMASERNSSFKNKKITMPGTLLKKKSIKIKIASRE